LALIDVDVLYKIRMVKILFTNQVTGTSTAKQFGTAIAKLLASEAVLRAALLLLTKAKLLGPVFYRPFFC
jgi:hypothetical protein